jgi:hypothetical protein
MFCRLDDWWMIIGLDGFANREKYEYLYKSIKWWLQKSIKNILNLKLNNIVELSL